MASARWATGWNKAAATCLMLAVISVGVMLASLGLTISEEHQYLENPTPPPWWTPYLGVAALMLVGLGMALFAVEAVIERGRAPRRSMVDLRPLIADRPLPFTVCSECRIIIDLPYAFSCPQCDRMDCCVRVESDEERGFASAAVGPPPS